MLGDIDASRLSLRRQCQLLGVNRSSYYYQPVAVSEEELRLLKQIDRIYTKCPFFGIRKMTHALKLEGFGVNHKRVQRLMGQLGLEALVPGPSTSKPHPEHQCYPYLLRGVKITHVNQVWSTDITFVPMMRGFCYLTAVIDWYSRYVLGFEVSDSLESTFCLEALHRALSEHRPEIFNTDQGSQFTSKAFTGLLQQQGIAISMDGRGRCFDNIFVERLWRTVKYEDIYLKDYQTLWQLDGGLQEYFDFYNTQRPHQSLDYRTPADVYFKELDPP
jgi:putative transposase